MRGRDVKKKKKKHMQAFLLKKSPVSDLIALSPTPFSWVLKEAKDSKRIQQSIKKKEKKKE